jgi:NAD-dependent dihydropyrimidine dehydrogenase PreA subunit
MPAIINFKICDNSKSCDAINICPTGAFGWNEEKKTLEINNDKCINCGLCATSEFSCQVGAIRFAKDEDELKLISKEIEDDPRTTTDLIVDRFGADPVNIAYYCNEEKLLNLLTSSKLIIFEFINLDQTECLIKSIPVKEIINHINEECLYRKVDIKSNSFIEKYDIHQVPSLLFFKNNNYLGKIEGYYSVDQKEELFSKINKILKI